MDLKEKRDARIVRDFVNADHVEGNQPFATEYLAARKKSCHECGGTGKCNCLACHHQNKSNCLFCNPSSSVIRWRHMTYRQKLGPPPVKGAETHTPTQRFLSYLPE